MQQPPSLSQELVYQARDLLVKACSLTNSRLEQSRLLDLIEIFREYTEKGVIQKTSSILTTQVASLELATKKIESQARKQPIQQTSNNTPTWANIAKQPKANSSDSTTTQKVQEWTKVARKGSSSGTGRGCTGSTTREAVTTAKGPSKSALSRRCTLLQARNVQAKDFSPLAIRNLINNAFKAKGIVNPVISTVSLSQKGNIIVTTTPEFNAEFLIKKEAIIKGVLPLIISIQKAEP